MSGSLATEWRISVSSLKWDRRVRCRSYCEACYLENPLLRALNRSRHEKGNKQSSCGETPFLSTAQRARIESKRSCDRADRNEPFAQGQQRVSNGKRGDEAGDISRSVCPPKTARLFEASLPTLDGVDHICAVTLRPYPSYGSSYELLGARVVSTLLETR